MTTVIKHASPNKRGFYFILKSRRLSH